MRTREEIMSDVKKGTNGFALILEVLLDVRGQNEMLLKTVKPVFSEFEEQGKTLAKEMLESTKLFVDRVFNDVHLPDGLIALAQEGQHQNALTDEEIKQMNLREPLEQE